ncbi:hypothetical protein BGX38DRAFT_1271535 [Terfezia claveryi]|nr:hypothetical protein BGX38DRAFT_1271535 [Terfezia claveryi]
MRKRCKDEFNWRTVFFCAAIVVAALAPVDPSIVFYPHVDASSPSSTLASDANALNSQLMKLDYSSHGALRAVSRIDNFDTTVRPHGFDLERMRKGGVNMGLQDAGELILLVNGRCEFKDPWFSRTINNTAGAQYDEWKLCPPGFRADAGIVPYGTFYPAVLEPVKLASSTGYNYYAILPYTTLNKSPVNGDDPWYAVQPITVPDRKSPGLNFEVKLPLACEKYDHWSYRDWKGHLANLTDTKQGSGPPDLKLSDAILTVLSQELSAPMIVATQLYRIIDQMLDDQGKGTTSNYTWREQTGQLPGVISSKDRLSPTGAARPAVIKLPSGHLRLTLAKVDMDQVAANETRWKTLRRQEPVDQRMLARTDEEIPARNDFLAQTPDETHVQTPE